MSGNNAFIKKLQKERTNYNHASQVRTLAKSIMQLSVGIYTEPERFVYELLQNAVDAFSDTAGEALEVLITVEGDKFMFMHNGKKFSEKDVEGISDVGNGDKANDSKKIGYKGIGFKSVFLPSVENVTILSGDFCFEFDKKKACSLMRRVLWKEKPLEEDEVPWQVIPIEVPEMANFNTQGFSVVTIVRTSELRRLHRKSRNCFLTCSSYYSCPVRTSILGLRMLAKSFSALGNDLKPIPKMVFQPSSSYVIMFPRVPGCSNPKQYRFLRT